MSTSSNKNKKPIPGVPETGPGSATVNYPRQLPAPSGRRRPHREREALNALVEAARRRRSQRQLPPNEAECHREARRELKKLRTKRRDPHHGVGHKIGDSNLKDFRSDLLNIKALRESDVGQELREQLQRNIGGRPTDHAESIAIQEMLLWSGRPLTVSECYARLARGNFDWPNLFGLDQDRRRPARSTVYDAIGGALRRDGHGRRPGLCDRIDPDFFDKALAETGRKLAAYAGERADRVLSIDGTLMQIVVPQRQSFSEEDEAALNGDFEAGYGTHGKSYVRGYNVMALTLSSVTAPVAITVQKANSGERRHTLALIETLYEHWPELACEYLVGDSAFDLDWRLYRDLMMRYGISLVAPRHSEEKIPEHLKAGIKGVPACRCTGTLTMMQMRSADGFLGPEKRAKLGLKPGEDAEELLRSLKHRMRVRYRCTEPGCQSKGVDLDPRTDFDGEQHNWRRATRLPHYPIHKSYEVRQELMAARNGSESVWNTMKACGLDAKGTTGSRWQNTRAQQEATIKAKGLRHSMLKLLENDGTLERVYAEAGQ